VGSLAVTVVDHGAGNIRSVVRACKRVGADVVVSADPAVVARADRIVLPGQGAFGDCMSRLRASGLDQVVVRHIEAERPYLGICLGLQVLFDEGLEHGVHRGLGVLRGRCIPLPVTPGIKIPHMGWNTVHHDGSEGLSAVVDGEHYYFVHSYHVELSGGSVPEHSTTEHGIDFVSAVAHGSLLACQFHPEKSHKAGLSLLEKFLT
jgi:glutamine amidotransferase